MVRTSPCFYIAPTAISVSPNANGSASDIAVNVVRGAKIKVYSPGVPALGYSDVSFQQWTLTGRNRRLADNTKPYSIYARLAKSNKEDGYLVFAPKVASGTEWLDKYAYVTVGGLATGTANKNSEDYWYVKLGEVSLPTNNARTVTLDTGILGTDKFNTDWNIDPDQMPLRIELSATIESKDAGDRPYVEWGKRLVLQAKLLEGWANANVQRFSHFTIQRNTGNASADTAYNYPDEKSNSERPSSGRQMPNGLIVLSHARGSGDVFDGTVSSTWTVIAWGIKANTTNSTSSKSASSKDVLSSSSSTNGVATADQYEMLAEKSINIMAETVEQYTLELSASVVNYDPGSDTYTPANGVDAMVRAIDQKGEVFKLTKAQLEAANLVVQYNSIANLDQWNDCKVTSATTDVAKANVPIEAFRLQQNVNVRLVKAQSTSVSTSSASSTSSTEVSKTTYKEIYRSHIALIRNGEDSKEREWIFLRSTVELSFAATADDNHKLLPSLIKGGEVKPKEAAAGTDTNKNQDGWVPQGWWDDSLGTNETYLYEYTAYRDYIKGNTSDSSSSGDAAQRGGHWGDFSTPRIWSHYGKDAVTYGVQVTPTYEVWSDAKKHAGIKVTYTKTTGTTVSNYGNVQVLGTAKVYADGTEIKDASDHLNSGYNRIIFDMYTFDGTNNTPTIGTASVISIELIVDDKIVATANYANGKQGADGKGALEISVAPDTLVFDTNDDGIVPNGTSKTATIACYRDGKKVTNVGYALTEGGSPDCSASISTSNSTATVTISNIDTDEPYGVSKTCGTVEVQVYDIDNGRYYFPTVKFAVNVAKFNGGLKADNKRFETTYNYLTNNGNDPHFIEFESKIRQTAKDISLHVSEKRAGRRNLLPGSAFRKQGEGCSIVQDGQDAINGICINGGYDGVNCARLRNERNAGAAYPRISWDGARNSNVKVAKGKKYTLSFWAKRLSSTEGGYEISTQFFLQNGANGSDRPYHALKMGSFTVKSQGEWEFIQDTVTIPSDAKSNYVEVCICLGLYQRGMAEILVCRPMLEEGEEYNGWTLSEQDYDYVGGNLLDGTATLAKTGNVEVLDGTVTQDGMGESASIKAELPPTGTYVDFLQFSTANMGLKANEDYTLSFYAKTEGNAGKLQCYLYPSDGDINTEDSESGYDNSYAPSDGSLQSEIVPGTRWKRYWVHWRPTKADPKHVLFRLMRGGNDRGTYSSYTTYAVDDVVLYDGTYYRCIMAGQGNTPSSSSSYWDATKYGISLSQPKLEVGATVTEFTAKRSDMVDKQALYATGIDIDSKKITLTADHTYVRTNDGTPMVLIDHDGLRATKIATTDNGGGHTEISGNSTVWYNKDGVTPGIKVFYDAAGVPHFQFCNSNGKVMYDFGPSGLQSFISSTQQAYSDECYLRDARSYVDTSGTAVTGFHWVYVARNQSADLRYIYRKQIPTTPASSASEIYDGCVFTSKHKYEGTDWPATSTSLANSRLLPDGWYVEPNDGNLPMKIRPADNEGVFDPTQTVYYQTFYYYSSGKVTRTVRAYMKKVSDTLVSKFKSTGEWNEV